MNAEEIRQMTTEEIQDELRRARENLFNLRFRWTTSQLRDHNVLKVARRDVARLKTILHERTLAREE